MIFCIASNTYQQIISSAIKASEEILVGNECSNEFCLLKYVKDNITNFSGIDIFIVDTCALQDTDDDIIQAFEMLRIMDCNMRVIVLAANRYEGNALLMNCFRMSIYDIITTDDFLKIKEELRQCITLGKQYKDALQFKEFNPADGIKEVKKNVNQIVIGVAGSETRIGVTHNTIVLVNHLRKKGYLVAIVEMNESDDFNKIRESFNEPIVADTYFSIKGIDYYLNSENVLERVLEIPYNFIIVDFGNFEFCDKEIFNRSDVKIIIAGAKPWEIDNVNSIFKLSSEELLKEYHFCFNFVLEKSRADIRDGMGKLENVYFVDYVEDPFIQNDFPNAATILEEYLPDEVTEQKEKTSFLKWRKK